MDSQSVKTTQIPGVRGYDHAKHVTGRKRHLLVDTLGLVLAVPVTPAAVSESIGVKQLMQRRPGSTKKLRRVWVGGDYKAGVIAWVAQHLSCSPPCAVHPRNAALRCCHGWLRAPLPGSCSIVSALAGR